MFIQRTLGQAILKASDSFRVILVTGPRQAGKTTLLQYLQNKGRSYITLDDLDTRLAAQQDPAGFIDRLRLPVLIDEVQYAPDLFPYIKMAVDQSQQPGQFWLTGSQQFSMMKNVSESLAGRVAVFELQGISLAEEESRPSTPAFIPTVEALQHRQEIAKAIPSQQIYRKIWRGSLPRVVLDDGDEWQRFYSSYVTTYVERDAHDYLRISDLMAFRKFMQATAARTGQLLNYRDLSKKIGISEPTIKSWLGVLQATGLITLVPPYFQNRPKGLYKTPKLYFMDTGLCCYLTRWLTPEVLESGAMAGAILETYAITEIIKSLSYNDSPATLYFYRDSNQREVDLLIEQAGHIHPVEIKKSASIRSSGFKGFHCLDQLDTPVGHGCVLGFSKSLTPFNRKIDLVPMGYL